MVARPQTAVCTPQQAARYLGVPLEDIYAACNARGSARIANFRKGTRYRIRTDDLDAWLARQCQ